MLIRDIFDSEVIDAHIDENDDGEKVGKVVAWVGTLDYRNLNGRTILSSGLKDSYNVSVSPYNHGSMYGDPPVGDGVIEKSNKRLKLTAELPFVLEGAEQAYLRIKLIKSMQYSIGYYVEEYERDDDEDYYYAITVKKADIFEASPVIYGASKGTRTVRTSDGKELDIYAADLLVHDGLFQWEGAGEDDRILVARESISTELPTALEDMEDDVIFSEAKKRGMFDDYRHAADIDRVVASIKARQ